jgi:sec-independent protein translocase protein TatC
MPSPPPERSGDTPAEEELQRMSLLDHLEDLRKRILYSVIALAVFFFPCWKYVKEVFGFLAAPIRKRGVELSYTGLTDPFIMYFKIAALAAVFLASPFILYQLWAFIAPGLYRREKLFAVPLVLFGTFFFLLGGGFAYYVAFPFAADFLLGIGAGLKPVILIDRYISFLLTVILGLGLMFELPVFIFLLSWVGIVSTRFLMRYFRHAVVIIFIVAAIITPTPDIVNLCIFAVPTVGLYVLGICAAFMVERFRRKKAEEEEASEA